MTDKMKFALLFVTITATVVLQDYALAAKRLRKYRTCAR